MYTKLLLWMFTSRSSTSRIPLDFSPKAVLMALALALIFSLILGNVFLSTLESVSISYLTSREKAKQIGISFPSSAESTRDKFGIIVPDYQANYPALSPEARAELEQLLKGSLLTITDFIGYLQKHISSTQSEDDILRDIHGQLIHFPFYVFEKRKIPDLMEEYAYYRPDTNQKLSEKGLQYFVIASLISQIREHHQNLNGVNLAHWLLLAFGGFLQWLIFIVAMTCWFLLVFKKGWAKMQHQLITKGKLSYQQSGENIWGSQFNEY